MAVYILRPDDVGHYSTGWDIQSAGLTTYWEVLNEKNQDGDINCVHTDVHGPFTVKLSNFFAGSFVRPCRIPGVMVVATVRSDNPNPANFRFRLRYCGHDYDSEIFTVSSTNYVEVVAHYPQLPNGDGWNAVRLSDLEIGLVYVDGVALWCTKLEVQVTTELYPHYTLVPTDVGTYQDWAIHPSTGPGAMAVQSFDGDESYIASDTTWSEMDSVSSYDLMSCYGFSETNVWAVGLQGTVLQYDGFRWIKRLAPTASPTTSHLYGVWGLDPADLWVVGQTGTILHYDGTDWLAHVSGTVYDLVAVWGASATDVWAVGVNGTALHYDGVSWSSVATGTTELLQGIDGVATNDIWVVGTNGALLHWNGIAWAITLPVFPGDDLRGIKMLGPADAWAVGRVGTTLQWNGVIWALVPCSTTNHLMAVWGSSSSNYVAVGEGGVIVHWNGTVWETLPTPTIKNLYGVWGATPYRIFVVGQDDTLLVHPDVAWWPKSTFLMDHLPAALAPPVIDRVNAGVLVKNQSETVVGNCAVVLRSGAVDYFGATGTDGQQVPLDEHWHALDTYWLNDPATGWPSGTVGTTPWVTPEVNGLEIGVLNLGGNLRCTSMALEVWLKHIPVATTTLVPIGDGYYYNPIMLTNAIPSFFPGPPAWSCVSDDPPDFGASYITGNATAAGTPLYSSFTVTPLAPLPLNQQIYCLQHRTWVQLGSTDHALVAPVFRLSGETYVGHPYRIDHTGPSWFLLRTPFFTSPFSSAAWTQAELASLEIGVVILEGEALITNVNIQVETAPLMVTAPPDPVDLKLTKGAVDMMNRSLLDGTIYAVTDFALGTGGFVASAPWQVVPVNWLDISLINEIYRDPVDRVTLDRDVSPPPPPPPPQPTTVRYWCRLPRDVIRDAIGEIGLYATILWSPFPAEIGTKFLFALQHIPCQCLHQRATQLFEVSITYSS